MTCECVAEELNSKSSALELSDNSTISLSGVRASYDAGLLSLPDVIECYREWVDIPYYGVVYRPDKTSVAVPCDFRGRTWHECKYKAFKLSKRGNDVYRSRVRKRFSGLSDLVAVCDDKEFLDLSRRTGVSNLLLVTLTCGLRVCSHCSVHFDQKLKVCPACSSDSYFDISRDESWRSIGKDLNLFLSNLKKRYGAIQDLRCFESFKNGYPHVHLIIHFSDFRFPVFRHRDKKGKLSFLVDKALKDEFCGYWHSYVKIEGVKNMGAVGYLLKYITKAMYTADGYMTIAYLWLFGRRSYGVSGKFVYAVALECERIVAPLLDTLQRNSNCDDFIWTYLCSVKGVFDHEYWTFEILDFFSLEELSELDGTIDFSCLFARCV